MGVMYLRLKIFPFHFLQFDIVIEMIVIEKFLVCIAGHPKDIGYQR